jgi:endonuclease IV
MFGPHVDRKHARGTGRPSITAHIRAARAAARKVDFDATAFQVFVAGPRNMSITLRPEEAKELRKYVEDQKVFVVAHGTYMDYPWHGALYPPKFIQKELRLCEEAGISGLVVHLGKPDISQVVKYLPAILSPQKGETETTQDRALLYLETPHAKPQSSHYETPEKLAKLFTEIRKVDKGLCRVGLCIDTAHLWSCGVDISDYAKAEKWLRRLEAVSRVIPPNRIMLHLNDSHDKLGSGLDHHAPLADGLIWKKYKGRMAHSGLAAFVHYALRNKVPTILERKPPKALLDDYTTLASISKELLLTDSEKMSLE